jgi:HEPN domain-containing protein
MIRSGDWLNEAKAELGAGRTLHANEHWSWCCVICQQAAEKALKAIYEPFWTPQIGHNMNLLLQADQFFEADANQAVVDAEEIIGFAENTVRSP